MTEFKNIPPIKERQRYKKIFEAVIKNQKSKIKMGNNEKQKDCFAANFSVTLFGKFQKRERWLFEFLKVFHPNKV